MIEPLRLSTGADCRVC